MASSSRSAITTAVLRRTSVVSCLRERLARRRRDRRGDRCELRGVDAALGHRDAVPQVGLVEQVEDLGVVAAAEVVEYAGGRAEVRDPAARCHDQDVVAYIERQDRVGDHHDDPAVVGQGAELAHHLEVQARVEPGRGLVEEEQRRGGEQLGGDRDPLALAARELGADPVVEALLELELLGDRLHPREPLLRAGVGRQPELGGVPQRLLDLQLRVLDVLLGHQTDLEPELVVVGIEVVALPDHPAVGGRAQAGERTEERRLAGTRGPDHGGQAGRLELQRDVVEQDLAAADHRGQPVGVQRELVLGGRWRPAPSRPSGTSGCRRSPRSPAGAAPSPGPAAR